MREQSSTHFMICWWYAELEWAGVEGVDVGVWKRTFHMIHIWNRREPPVLSLASNLSGFSLFSPSSLLSSPVLSSCLASTGAALSQSEHRNPRAAYIHGPLKEEAARPLLFGRHLPSSSASLGETKRAPDRGAGFVTKATCWAGQPVVRQERSLWQTQVLGCPLACLSVSPAVPTGHLYSCNFKLAKTRTCYMRGRGGGLEDRDYTIYNGVCFCACIFCKDFNRVAKWLGLLWTARALEVKIPFIFPYAMLHECPFEQCQRLDGREKVPV